MPTAYSAVLMPASAVAADGGPAPAGSRPRSSEGEQGADGRGTGTSRSRGRARERTRSEPRDPGVGTRAERICGRRRPCGRRPVSRGPRREPEHEGHDAEADEGGQEAGAERGERPHPGAVHRRLLPRALRRSKVRGERAEGGADGRARPAGASHGAAQRGEHGRRARPRVPRVGTEPVHRRHLEQFRAQRIGDRLPDRGERSADRHTGGQAHREQVEATGRSPETAARAPGRQRPGLAPGAAASRQRRPRPGRAAPHRGHRPAALPQPPPPRAARSAGAGRARCPPAGAADSPGRPGEPPQPRADDGSRRGPTGQRGREEHERRDLGRHDRPPGPARRWRAAGAGRPTRRRRPRAAHR